MNTGMLEGEHNPLTLGNQNQVLLDIKRSSASFQKDEAHKSSLQEGRSFSDLLGQRGGRGKEGS